MSVNPDEWNDEWRGATAEFCFGVVQYNSQGMMLADKDDARDE